MPKSKGSYAWGSKGAGKSPAQWFWEGVTIPPGSPQDQCWLWARKSASVGGYGIFKKQYAHRFSYELAHGPIGPNLLVCHKCDTPKCVNPHHLFLGTHQDNMADARRKQRTRGRSPKLRAAEVQELRALAAVGVPYDDLEAKFGLNRCSLHDAVHRKTYRWVA